MFSSDPLGQFLPNLAKSIPGWTGFKFVQLERPHLFTTGDNIKKCKKTFTKFIELLGQFYDIYNHNFTQMYWFFRWAIRPMGILVFVWKVPGILILFLYIFLFLLYKVRPLYVKDGQKMEEVRIVFLNQF